MNNNKSWSVAQLKDAFDNAMVKLSSSIVNGNSETSLYTAAYINMFGEHPHLISLDSEGYYLNKDAEDFDIVEEDDEYVEEEDEKDIYRYETIALQETMINFYNHYKDVAYIIRKDEYPVIIADHLILFWNGYSREIDVLLNSEHLPDEIDKLVVDKKSTDDKRYVTYVTSTPQGFSETSMQVRKQDIDLSLNYNDDLPHDQIIDFLKSNKSGLVLLHGLPGSGKTSYIRHLMYTLKGRRFIILDNSVFAYITDASFISLLLENKNSVIILEDCEAMLSDRLTGNNQLATLLNLSDGILGDSFNFKFICTFNANIAKLDKAILRKGRLKVKYEFKNLAADKTKALCEKIGKTCKDGESLSLADIFNYEEETGVKEERKIGFGK